MTSEFPKTPSAVNKTLLKAFRLIDSEAKPVEVDYPTGLWWYVGHLDRDLTPRKINNTEVAWSRRLTEMLATDHPTAFVEHRYPGETRDRCDCVVQNADLKTWWIEVKGAWKTVFDSGRPNTAFIKHLHATAHDVEKLESLNRDNVFGVSLVLIGFDRVKNPIDEKHLDIVRSAMLRPWVEESSMWDVVGRVSFRTRIWAWSTLTI